MLFLILFSNPGFIPIKTSPIPFLFFLFTAHGDKSHLIFGRNFDNPDNDVLRVRYHHPNGYSSLAFTRMSDLGFPYGTNYINLTFEQRLNFLKSAYFVPDVINEHGLAAGLASVQGVSYNTDPGKDKIFITRLIREILDHTKNVDEALSITNSYNVFGNGVGVISHHLHIGSSEGTSLTLEFADGEFKTVVSDSAWQVLTNIPVYNLPHSQLMNSCWGYTSLYTRL